MSLLNSLKDKLSKTRHNLVNRIKETVSGKANLDPTTIDRLEEILLSSDIGFDLTNKIIENVRVELLNVKNRANERIVFDVVKSVLNKIFSSLTSLNSNSANNFDQPYVILVLGVNGVGKTTTIGKLAYNFNQDGKKVIIAAADTFRAAANEQLAIWSERAKADIVIKDKSIDPAAVTFETIEKAIDENYNVVLIDTAGRLHNKKHLMDELEKLNRIIVKKLNRPSDETLLVLDGNSGQNAILQVEEFSKIVKITGLVITKLDGTAKGGIVFQIIEKLHIPVRYIGVGETIYDLRAFNPDEFIAAILNEA